MSPHYDEFLAPHYTWMFGVPHAALVDEQLDVLRQAGVAAPTGTGIAVDLGCGSGFQSVALARLGYPTVLAVDTSAKLLAELRDHASPAIQPIHADLRSVAADLAPGTVELAVCMGDTLTHLPDQPAVVQLLADLHRALAPGGRLLLTFRDLTAALAGTDRFLPVHADTDTILTCFLEYERDAVIVHDLLYRRTAERAWTLSASSYRKLRIAPAWLADQLRAVGFTAIHDAPAARRMVLLTAIQP